MQENLLKIKEYLNVSPKEDTLYASVISIGDALILNEEGVPVYICNTDLRTGENYKTSYYGTSEIRLVKSIVMAKDNTEAEVDNMDDYELFKSLGFQVIRYILVNQYSLQEDGTLQEEGRYETEGLQFAYQQRPKTRVRLFKKDTFLC